MALYWRDSEDSLGEGMVHVKGCFSSRSEVIDSWDDMDDGGMTVGSHRDDGGMIH